MIDIEDDIAEEVDEVPIVAKSYLQKAESLKPLPDIDVPAPKPTVPVRCPFCDGEYNFKKRDKCEGYECPHCESVFLGNGTGVTIEHGVLTNLANARCLKDELASSNSATVSGPFRGNANLSRIPEITLPTMAGVSIAATKAGMKIEKNGSTSIFLTK